MKMVAHQISESISINRKRKRVKSGMAKRK